ncbi:hypothetical protein I4U23_001436 [Adineta vaga]|nr:hypothetical protein I4U23_001436 [Adineta vaga]
MNSTLVIETANEILKQTYGANATIQELLPLATRSPLSSNNTDLVCFTSINTVQQCAIVKKIDICVILHQFNQKNSITHSCDRNETTGSPVVTIYHSDTYSSFKLDCHQPFHNGDLTFAPIKDIVYKYNVTKTRHGRLVNHSSTFVISIA